MRTVAVYSQEDRFSLHRTKADEAYLVGQGRAPVEAHLDIADILRAARGARVDAVHRGYGFLAENPEFARACLDAGLLFVGPAPETMRLLGNKVSARELAIRLVESEAQLEELLPVVPVARREAQAAFGNDEVYLEKLGRRARQLEVQILGDPHGALVHLHERNCSMQRRNQKVVERAPVVFLSDAQRAELTAAALAIGRTARYVNAGNESIRERFASAAPRIPYLLNPANACVSRKVRSPISKRSLSRTTAKSASCF